MEDKELTRKAVEELMKETDEYKEKEIKPTERKKNPLGRPNKLFLGRTINSMMTHNKRQCERNLQGCERKLKELDAKQKRHRRYVYNEECINKRSKKIKKKKRKWRKKKRRYSSSSSTSSGTETDSSCGTSKYLSLQSKHLNKKNERHKPAVEGKEFQKEYVKKVSMGYYVDPNVAFAAMAYNQIKHMMHQKHVVHQQMSKKELEDSVEIPSDLSISIHSSPTSSLSISFNSSSAEEDENGILTFKLSSEDEVQSRISYELNKEATNIKINENMPLDCGEIDRDSVCSHISLESKGSPESKFENTNEICLLSTTSSDSEDLEIVETIAE